MPDNSYAWPYANEFGQTETVECDVLVLGGGLSGCFAAIAAARRGQKVVVVEKGSTKRSGAGGTGFDHWESACTNPCSKVTPEEIAYAYVDEQDHYSNGISHYIECREGWDRLLDLESFGGKIRDTDDEFKGADFRDDETKLMFAYDYENRFTLRVWGTTFKPALYNELRRLGVKIYDRTEATSLLTRTAGGKKRGIGAIGMNVHTGRLIVFKAKATLLTMSRPARVWLFDPDLTGLCEFRPMQSIGSGHAMGWRAGVEFTMMEKSVKAEFSAAGRSFPPYGTGNNHNTWYAATMVDARGVEIPYLDRDGNVLKTVRERYYPVKGQKFFLKGGVIDEPKYEYRGPETMPFDELMLVAIAVYVFLGVPNIDLSRLSVGETLGGGLTLTSFSATVGLFTSTLSGAGSVSQIADDTRNPRRDIPLTLILAPTIVCIIYMLMALVTLGCMEGNTVANLADVGGRFLGSGLLTFFIVGGPICGIMTSIVPVIMLSCALIQVSADHEVFPKFVGRRNSHGVSPVILIFVVGFSVVLVALGNDFGELMTIFSFVNTACAVPTCIVPFFLRRRYPHACNHGGLKLNLGLVYVLSVFALVVSVYLAIAMFIELSLSSWVIIIATCVITAVYFIIRVYFIKSRGGDLMADLRSPYAEWEAREAECARLDAAK